MLMQDVQLQLIGPPVGIRWGASYSVLAGSSGERALCFVGHGFLLNLLLVCYVFESMDEHLQRSGILQQGSVVFGKRGENFDVILPSQFLVNEVQYESGKHDPLHT
jgi:hypothetical protein